jgi:hypothetical protein
VNDEKRSDTPPAGEPGGGGARRLLVVVGEAVTGDRLRDEIAGHLEGSEAEVYVLSPALAKNRLRQFSGDVDEGIEAAQERLEQTLAELRENGIDASGTVGDSEPDRAIEDALQTFPADEIVLVTHRDEDARWLESEAFERAGSYFEQPVTRLVVEQDGDSERVVDTDEAPAGRQDRPEDEPQPRNLPPLAPRDIFGIVVAIGGTIALFVLAAAGDSGEAIDESSVGGVRPGQGDEGLNGCDGRLLIAGGLALINLAHIGGLLLFESLRYRGFWAKFFSWMSLIGTPVAIVVSLIIG